MAVRLVGLLDAVPYGGGGRGVSGRRVVGRTVILLTLALLLALPAVALAVGDPYRDQQWALDRIGADIAWAGSDAGEDVIVAVVDTGIDLEHPDLRDRFLRDADGAVVGLDLVADGEPHDEHGHGTLVAGVIAATADNGVGITGVAPQAHLLPIRVLDEVGAGDGNDVDTAIRWAVDQGADVVNLSLESVEAGGDGVKTPGAPTEAVRYAWEHGVVVVAAAGNAGAAPTEYPVDSPVLLVGAVDRDDRRAPFSSGVREDAVLAPGVDIISTWCRAEDADRCERSTHTYGMAEGTSFAAPHVSGAIALLLAAGHDPAEAVARLRDTAVDLGPPGPDPDHGHGRIDIGAAMSAELATAQQAPPASADAFATPPATEAFPEASTPATPEPTAQSVPHPPDDPEPPTDPEPPQAVALPVDQPPSAPPGGRMIHLLAAVCLGVTLATWSAVARRHA